MLILRTGNTEKAGHTVKPRLPSGGCRVLERVVPEVLQRAKRTENLEARPLPVCAPGSGSRFNTINILVEKSRACNYCFLYSTAFYIELQAGIRLLLV